MCSLKNLSAVAIGFLPKSRSLNRLHLGSRGHSVAELDRGVAGPHRMTRQKAEQNPFSSTTGKVRKLNPLSSTSVRTSPIDLISSDFYRILDQAVNVVFHPAHLAELFAARAGCNGSVRARRGAPWRWPWVLR